jgi:hypothetical protein
MNNEKLNHESSTVIFEKIDDNLGKVITERNGELFTIELFTLTKDNIAEIRKLREEIKSKKLTIALSL